MNLFKVLGELLTIYILYKVIFDFIIPMYNATKEIKGKMTDMQMRMQEQQRAQAAQQKQYEQDRIKQTVKPDTDDYIDYEEMK